MKPVRFKGEKGTGYFVWGTQRRPRGMRGITYETTRRGERPKQGSLSPFSGPTSGGSDFLDGGEGDELQLERMVA
ncbi:MAG: hypothetical protein DMG05_25560 [Acidobacteria bacterium]|nr:MAG: hypothetical protein DMG05_25560 [Acidobacteriota bacterium]